MDLFAQSVVEGDGDGDFDSNDKFDKFLVREDNNALEVILVRSSKYDACTVVHIIALCSCWYHQVLNLL